jgi:hypothetical protein
MKCGGVKDNGYNYKFYLNRYFNVAKVLNMTIMQNIEVVLGQKLNHSV